MDKKFSLLYIPNGIIDIAILAFYYFKVKPDFLFCLAIFIIAFIVYFSFNFFMNKLYISDIQEFYSTNKNFTVSSLIIIGICILKTFDEIDIIMIIPIVKAIAITSLAWAHHAKTDKLHYHQSELEKREEDFFGE